MVPTSRGNTRSQAQRKTLGAALRAVMEQRVEGAGSLGALLVQAGSVDSCQGERGRVEGFKRKRLHQSCVLESSLTAGWRIAQRGKSRCGERRGQNGDGGGNGEAGAGVSLDLPGAQGPARKPTRPS